MKHIRNYSSFYNLNESKSESEILSALPPSIDISEFSRLIGLSGNENERFIELWSQERPNFDIHYFPFQSQFPIMGVFFYDKDVCINNKTFTPPLFKAFVALHESRHGDQYSEGIFEPGYFQTVVDGNEEEFLKNYRILEDDANTFALETLAKYGFGEFVRRDERRIRGNENMGRQIYEMMSQDIERIGATSMAELIASQIL
jgi:hypothetical protein